MSRYIVYLLTYSALTFLIPIDICPCRRGLAYTAVHSLKDSMDFLFKSSNVAWKWTEALSTTRSTNFQLMDSDLTETLDDILTKSNNKEVSS